MLRAAALISALLLGGGYARADADSGSATDGAAPPDIAVGAGADFAIPDLAGGGPPADSAQAPSPDLARAPDLARTPDLARPPDSASGADLSPQLDLAAPADATAQGGDLAGVDGHVVDGSPGDGPGADGHLPDGAARPDLARGPADFAGPYSTDLAGAYSPTDGCSCGLAQRGAPPSRGPLALGALAVMALLARRTRRPSTWDSRRRE